MTSNDTFGDQFVWGAATASYQIEGATDADGRTDSIWDTFCRVSGAVVAGDTGEVACDHYHRWPADLDLLSELGLNAYRFSIAWPRIVPRPGEINQAGLDFYSRLVDGLLERGITPWVTLYHWDLPQWAQDAGGWPNRETVDHFVFYATAVHAALGDRVNHWLTLNEPWCAAFLGHAGGQHAPGHTDPGEAVATAHHLLLAHGRATRALRAVDPNATLGITLNFTVTDPATSDPADVRAARLNQAMLNDVFAGPVLGRGYPAEVLEAWRAVEVSPPVHEGDLAEIAAPIDVLGVNYYRGELISATPPPSELALPIAAPTERPTHDPNVGLESYPVSRGLPLTEMGWEVQPDGLRRLLIALHELTGPAGIGLVITENGAAFADEVTDGQVVDPDRESYLVEHLRAVAEARAAGADVRGYFVWSLLDNFEWAWGYDRRFGIVRVDFTTQERTIKASGRRYASIVRSGTLTP